MGRGSTPGPHLIHYDALQKYTGVTIQALHNASRQLRRAGLNESRREWKRAALKAVIPLREPAGNP